MTVYWYASEPTHPYTTGMCIIMTTIVEKGIRRLHPMKKVGFEPTPPKRSEQVVMVGLQPEIYLKP